MKCERPGCSNECPGDYLYCSERCYDLDHGSFVCVGGTFHTKHELKKRKPSPP